MGSAFVALSLTIIAFSQVAGYVPVSFPIYRVYRHERPAYFWTLMACYVLIGTSGVYVLAA